MIHRVKRADEHRRVTRDRAQIYIVVVNVRDIERILETIPQDFNVLEVDINQVEMLCEMA